MSRASLNHTQESKTVGVSSKAARAPRGATHGGSASRNRARRAGDVFEMGPYPPGDLSCRSQRTSNFLRASLFCRDGKQASMFSDRDLGLLTCGHIEATAARALRRYLWDHVSIFTKCMWLIGCLRNGIWCTRGLSVCFLAFYL